jgi:tetratricopeptide (TPR) repeat protein
VHTLLRRAEVFSAKGQLAEAYVDLQRVLAIRPTRPAAEHALLLIGERQMSAGDRVSAKRTYDRLVGIAPLNAQAWCNRGIVRSGLHMDAPALADLEKAVELDPTLDKAYAHMAVVLFRMDRVQEACYALQQARDLGDMSIEELLFVHCE